MPMSLSILDRVRVASPCPVPWETMAGDERARFCARCQQHVFNLSGMAREEAEALIRAKQGLPLCIRYYQRADGAVMTRDCPEQRQQQLRRRQVLALGLGVSLLVGLFGWAESLSKTARDDGVPWRLRDWEPLRTICEWLDPTPPPPVIMGKLCFPPELGGEEPGPAAPPAELLPPPRT